MHRDARDVVFEYLYLHVFVLLLVCKPFLYVSKNGVLVVGLPTGRIPNRLALLIPIIA
jgi:hypothetical protein